MTNSIIDMCSKIPRTSALPPADPLKVYPTRWLILLLFACLSMFNAMQWIQYSIITPVVTSYYGISEIWVNWTSLIYMILYIPFIFPASYILEKLGLRLTITMGCLGTCIGSWIKVASVDPERFYIGFLGQSVVGLSQIFILSVPARLAAIWFGPDQVSSACSIGVFGNQIGVAAGFLIPPMIVTGGTTDEVTMQLYILFTGVASLTSVLLAAILLFFRSAPPTPPSLAVQQQNEEEGNFFKSLKSLVKNRSFNLLFQAYGINIGVFYALSTLLSEIVLKYYKDAVQDAGRIGLVITVAGMIGSVCCGYTLDRFRKFKETTIVVYAFSLFGMMAFTFTITKGLVTVYIMSGILGFFMTGLLTVGFEMGSELTYPEPEGTQAGLLNAAAQIYGIVLTNIYSALFYNVNDIWANITMCIFLAAGLLMVSCVSSHLRRQAALSGEK